VILDKESLETILNKILKKFTTNNTTGPIKSVLMLIRSLVDNYTYKYNTKYCEPLVMYEIASLIKNVDYVSVYVPLFLFL
jgi:hypothetical protein